LKEEVAKNHREFGFAPPSDKRNKPLCREEEIKLEKAID